LAEKDVNILDISQTIVQEYFNMMMIVDMGKMNTSFETVADELADLGKSIGVQVKCQREEIFNMMHRI
jgi:ACT domain-containing protein